MADFARYIGTWVFTDGELEETCGPNMPTEVTPTRGAIFQVQRGTDTAFVVLQYPCTWKVDIMGNEAWFRAGQTCSGVTSTGHPGTAVLLGGRLTPTSSSTDELAFRMSLSDPDSQCSASVRGNAVKQR
jgi:hypothetical protein